jgi:HEAT repeat protein
MTVRQFSPLVAALLLIAGCTGLDRDSSGSQSGPVILDASVAEKLLDKSEAALTEAMNSHQPPLQSLAFETFLVTGRTPPEYDFRALDPRVRVVALAMAVKQRAPQAAEQATLCLNDGDPSVRLAGAWGRLVGGDGSQATMLRDGLASPDVSVRRNAAWLFGLMDNRTAVDMLKTRLDDPDAVVVLRAAEALGRLGSSDGLDAVRSLTEHERHEIRCWSTRLLGRIGAKADIPRLERLAESRFLDVKFAAIGSLARLGNFTRIEFLVAMLDATPGSLRRLAKEDSQLAAVIAGMKDEELEESAANLRRMAARELGETGYAPALVPLGKIMDSKDLLERTIAASSTYKILWESQPWIKRAMTDQPTSPGTVPVRAQPLDPRGIRNPRR